VKIVNKELRRHFWFHLNKPKNETLGYRIAARFSQSQMTKIQPNHQPIGPIQFAEKGSQESRKAMKAFLGRSLAMAGANGNKLYGMRRGTTKTPDSMSMSGSPRENHSVANKTGIP